MTYLAGTCTIRTVRPGDPAFVVVDGMIMSTRAGFELSPDCPAKHRAVIREAIENAWLLPVAYMKDSELVWETLQS